MPDAITGSLTSLETSFVKFWRELPWRLFHCSRHGLVPSAHAGMQPPSGTRSVMRFHAFRLVNTHSIKRTVNEEHCDQQENDGESCGDIGPFLFLERDSERNRQEPEQRRE